MLDALNNLLGFAETVFNWFVSFLEAIGFAVVALTSSIGLSVALVPYVPAIVGSAITIFVGIYVVKFLIGR